MTKYVVTGGTPIRGTIALAGAKNAGFKAMIASLLGDSTSTIGNLGLISEINFAKSVISSLGGVVKETSDPHGVEITPSLNSYQVPVEVGAKSRSVTMYVGPLLKKFGKAVLPMPGGDPISARPIDRHIEGLTALGAKIEFKEGAYHVEAPNGLTGTRFRFKKNTHTGTETMLMCAVFAKGETILENAAAEPEIDDLITLLNAMGGNVIRLDGRTIKVVGVEKLRGVNHSVMADRIEAATFACMTIATKGDVTVIGAEPLVLNAFLVKLNEAGGRWEKTPDGIRFWYEKPIKATAVETAPYPQFMTDWQPMWTALMTQAQGISVVHETIHERRFDHIGDLTKMGGKFEFFEPVVSDPDKVYNFNLEDDKPGALHAVKIYGPVDLQGAELEVNDIRRGATVLLAGLAAKGKTIIFDSKDQINRGYENLIGRLKSLGADIEIVEQEEVEYTKPNLWANS